MLGSGPLLTVGLGAQLGLTADPNPNPVFFGILAAMWLMFLPQVRGIENDNATSLSLLILLALGTFLAGVHARVWRICIVGAFLAVAVPAVAWIQESVMLLLVVVLLGVAVVLGFWWLRHREG